MGKTVATIGAIVTAAALIATGVGAAAGAGLLGATAAAAATSGGALTLFGVSVSEIALIGTGLSVVGGLLQGKPKVGGDYGTQVDWKADPSAGVPLIVGRTGIAGNIVLKDVAGDKNKYLFVTTVLSAGPVQSVGGYLADSVLVQFGADGGEGASGGQITTSLASAAAAGATSVVVASVQGFAAGQTVTIGGEGATIKTVYSVGSVLQLKGALAQAHGANAQVLGPSSTDFYKNRMWRKVALGAASEPQLTFSATGSKDTPANHAGVPASWGPSARLSGLAHTIQAFEYDAAVYPTGEPRPMQVVEGAFHYDPRLDSTYAGGAGGHRWADPLDLTRQSSFDAAQDSWSYSANPYIVALNWLLGRWGRDRANPAAHYVRTLGVGIPIAAIDVAAFVEGANIADAHGWTCGGQIYSTDPKWDVLVSLLQAGSGRPLKLGATVSCLVNAPKVSLDTLTGDDVVGEASIQATQAGRDRINAIWPRYREEAQGWQIVPTDAPVVVPQYFAADGGQRTKEVEYTLASGGPDHVATLARYDIENSREFGPISLRCKPRWMGYRPGDCITITEPEFGLNGQKCLILNRSQDPATMAVTLTLRSETDGKHPFALGETADPPGTPGLTGVDPTYVSVPSSSEWAASLGAVQATTGESLPAILIVGSCSDPNVAQIIVEYSVAGSGVWVDGGTLKASATSTALTGVAPNTAYLAGLRYRSVRGVVGDRLVLTPTGATGAIVSTSTNSVTLDTFITGAAKRVSDLLAQANDASARLDAISAKHYDQAISDLQSARQTLDGEFSALSGAYATLNSTITDPNTGLVKQLNLLQSRQGDPTNPAAGTILARLGTSEQAITSLQTGKADASRVSVIEAELGSPSGSGSVYSRLSSLESASSGAGYATASSVQQLEAVINGSDTSSNDAKGLASRISNVLYTQVDLPNGIASTSALQRVAASVGGTGAANLLANGDFSQGATAWSVSYGNVSLNTDQGSQLTYFPGSGDLGTGYRVVASQTYLNGIGGGSTYSLRARLYTGFIGSPSTFARVSVQWLDASSNLIRLDVGVQTNQRLGWNDYLSSAGGGYLTAPSNARSARVVVELVSSGGNLQGSGDAFQVTRVKLEQGQVCSPFSNEQISASVGVQATAIATLQSYAASQYSISLDANGVQTGLKLIAANGATTSVSAAIFYADLFAVRTRSGAQLSFTDFGGGTLTVPNLIVGTRNIGAGAVTAIYHDTRNYNETLPANGSAAPSTTTSSPTGTGSASGGSTGYTGGGGSIGGNPRPNTP